jgi:FlaA1/EpsC-like NDP-sugar epimerase
VTAHKSVAAESPPAHEAPPLRFVRPVTSTHRAWAVRAIHAGLIVVSLAVVYLLLNDYPAAAGGFATWGVLSAVVLLSKSVVFEVFRLHRFRWRTFGSYDILAYAAANMAGSVTAWLAHSVISALVFPLAVWVTDALLCQTLLVAACLIRRAHYEHRRLGGKTENRKRALIYGAGRTGLTLLRETRSCPELPYEIVGFIDDDPSIANIYLQAAPVLGKGTDLPRLARLHDIEEVLIAMPRATPQQQSFVSSLIALADLPAKAVPDLADLMKGRASRVDGDSLNESLFRLAAIHGAAGVDRQAIEARPASKEKAEP